MAEEKAAIVAESAEPRRDGARSFATAWADAASAFCMAADVQG
ncbi:hypothetical protein [Chenggangzhangella methanolivorans]